MQNITLTIKEQEQYDSWNKEQIYEAYILENRKANTQTKEVHKLQRIIAEIKFLAGGR